MRPWPFSERAAIAITGMSAYTNGFEFSVTRLIKAGTPGWDQDPEPGVPGEPFAAHRSFEVRRQFSDGRTVIGKRPPANSEPTEPFLRPAGASGSSARSRRSRNHACSAAASAASATAISESISSGYAAQ